MLLAAAVAVSAGVNLLRLGHLTSDQFSIAPMIQKSIDPELYSRDPIYGNPANYDFYLPYYRHLLEGLMGVTGDVSLAYWALMTGMTLVTVVAFWLLYVGMKVRPTWAAVGAILSSLPRLAPSQEINGAGVMETALPRTFVTMMLPLVMLVFFRSRGRGWQCLLSFFAVGVVGNLHPQSALFLTAVLMVLLIWQRHRELWGWITAGVGGLVSLIGISPFIMSFEWTWGGSSGGGGTGLEGALNTLLFFKSAPVLSGAIMEQIIAKAEIYGNVVLFVACVAPMLGAGWMVRRLSRDGAGNEAAETSWRAALVATGLGLVAGSVFSFLPVFGGIGWLISLHWLRAMRLVAPLVMIAVVLWMGRSQALSQVGRWKGVLLAGLVVFPTAMTMVGLETVYLRRYYPYKEVALQAGKMTPKDCLILTEPVGGCAFRVWSKRSIILAQADKNFFVGRDRAILREFVSTVGKAYEKKKPRVVMRYARSCGADYVVLPMDGSTLVEDVPVCGEYYLSRVWTKRPGHAGATPKEVSGP